MTFHIFYFNDFLSFEQIQPHFPHVSVGELKYSYWNWNKSLDRHLNRFYTAQWNMHQNLVYNPLSKRLQCDIETMEERYPLEFHEAKHREGLTQHFAQLENWSKSDRISKLAREYGIKDSGSLADIVPQLVGRVFRVETFDKDFDALWFNYLIDKFPRDIQALKRLPYPEYLDTEYWRYVRALMLILYGARCQGSDLYFDSSYWNGSESKLHVHHLSYKNRGAERFTDLTLLCENCHKKIHRTGETNGH